MIVSNVDSRLFDEIDIGSDRQTILNEYLDYCKEQNDKGEPYSRTLKHVFGLNRGLKNAKAFRSLILETMQKSNLEITQSDLISLV